MTHDVFISYSSKDKPVADGVCANLEAAGVRCWIAPRDIDAGEDWPTAITNAIAASRILVLVFSASSNSSADVSRELFLAADKKLVIIPFKIENIAPEPGKQYYLARTHWLDAMNPPTRQQLGTLIERVRALLPGQPVPPVQPMQEAPPMQRKRGAWKRLWWIPAALVVGLAVLAGLLFFKVFLPQKGAEDLAAPLPTTSLVKEPTQAAAGSFAALPEPLDWDIERIEDFSANDYSWPEWSGVDDQCSLSSLGIQGGKLVLSLDAHQDYHCMYYAYGDSSPVSDFDLSVEVERTGGEGSAVFGAAFGITADDYYAFLVSSKNRNFTVQHMLPDGTETLVDWTSSPVIRAEGVNTLSLSARGGELFFSINGTLVESLQGVNIAAGDIGIFGEVFSGGQAVIAYDNLVIRGVR